jgi:predicted oxidoreductase
MTQINRRLAYGFWRFSRDDHETATAVMGAAREAGITYFDTADCYGETGFGDGERLLGDIRRESPSLFEGAEIATKAGVEFGTPYRSAKDYVSAALDASLERLGVERVDLFYIHRPDVMTHPQEVAEALDGSIAAGKTKAVGVSNYSPSQVDALRAYLKAPLLAHQVEFSVLHIEPVFNGVFDQAMAQRSMSVYAWSPLGGGALMNGDGERAERVRRSLQALAAKYDVSLAVAALAFVMAHPAAPTPILGTKNPERVKDAVAALGVRMARKEWYDVLQAALGEKLP